MRIIQEGCTVQASSHQQDSVLKEPWVHQYSRVLDKQQSLAIQAWASEELAKSNIAEVPREQLIGISPLFAIPKSNGGWRVIHDLTTLNKRCQDKPFTMESIATVRKLWSNKKWGCTLDLKDAFRHLQVAPQHQNLFGFQIPTVTGETKYYKHTALPFGWKQSPFYWNMMAQAMAFRLRSNGLTVVVYVDDVLVMANTQEEAQAAIELTVTLIEQMGITINKSKSVLKPAQVIKYLGYVINLKNKTVTITLEKRLAIRHMAARELKALYTTKLRMSKLIGVLQGAREALPWINPMTSTIYRWFFTIRQQSWTEPVNSWGSCSRELRYWASLKSWQTTTKHQEDESMEHIVAVSDASTTGWGLRVTSVDTGKVIIHAEDTWKEQDYRQHSTAKELRAMLLGAQQLAYIVKRGATITYQIV